MKSKFKPERKRQRRQPLRAARGSAVLHMPCRKCSAPAIYVGLCREHALKMIKQFEAQSQKANLVVGTAQPNTQLSGSQSPLQ